MGLDGVTPESFPDKVKEKKTKVKKSTFQNAPKVASRNVASTTNEKFTKGKFAENKTTKFQNKNNVPAEAFGNKPALNSNNLFNQPAQNKKIIFDKSYIGNNSKREENNGNLPTGIIQNPQNKKVIFDEEYIVNSSNNSGTGANLQTNSSESKESWYHLLIKPDIPWYQQDKTLNAVQDVSTEEVKKCEEEGKRYLEEDTTNYQKGTLPN